MHGGLPNCTSQFWVTEPSTYRFRQVPTFGRDTIRRFGGNVSAMKKLAGRDFEDIMQVSVSSFLRYVAYSHNFSPFSVGSQFLKAFYRTQNITRPYLILPLTSPPSMLTENFACTHHTRSSLSEPRQRNLAANSVTMPTTYVLNTQQSHCRERQLQLTAAELRKTKRLLLHPNSPRHQT
jgi:hypothetical protein